MYGYFVECVYYYVDGCVVEDVCEDYGWVCELDCGC